MRVLLLALMSAAAVSAQSTTTAVTAETPQLSLQAIVAPEAAAPNAELTITFAVTPARGVHVYAPGAHYQVIAAKLDPQAGVTARKMDYPPSEIYYFEPLDERVPVYQRPFELKQPVRVSAAALKGKKTLKLSGRLEYQACDDRVCFKPTAIPFAFELAVKRP